MKIVTSLSNIAILMTMVFHVYTQLTIPNEEEKGFNQVCILYPGCDSGLVKEGEICDDLTIDRSIGQGNCQDGLVCTPGDLEDPEIMNGTCKYDTDRACNNNDDCGQYDSRGRNVCFQGKCARLGDKGQSCKSINDCIGAYICNQGICGNQNYLPVGTLCKDSTECQYSCGADHKCSSYSHSCDVGGSCPKGWRCNAGTCYEP